jgi:hypothetical protein
VSTSGWLEGRRFRQVAEARLGNHYSYFVARPWVCARLLSRATRAAARPSGYRCPRRRRAPARDGSVNGCRRPPTPPARPPLSGEQLGQRHPRRLGRLPQVEHRDVPLAPLDRPDERPVQRAQLAERPLHQPLRQPPLAEANAQVEEGRRLRRPVEPVALAHGLDRPGGGTAAGGSVGGTLTRRSSHRGSKDRVSGGAGVNPTGRRSAEARDPCPPQRRPDRRGKPARGLGSVRPSRTR